MKYYSILLLLSFLGFSSYAQIGKSTIENPSNAYYLFPREGKQQFKLEADWQLAWAENPVQQVGQLHNLKDWINVAYPTSVHMALFKSGKLPDPYVDLNSKQYEWIVKKAWYYKKSFRIEKQSTDNWVFLCFDGIDYFAKVWLNGELLGQHEGMFGGPEFEVSKQLRYNNENELIIEVLAGNYYMGNDEKGADQKGIITNAFLDNARRVIKPWSLAGGYSHEMFYIMGMWQGARLEFVPRTHLERPFLSTISINDNEAVLNLKTELLIDKNSLECSVHPWENKMLVYDIPPAKYIKGEKLSLKLKLSNGTDASEQIIPIQVFEGRNWIEKEIKVKTPKLWWPNGMGKQNLYKAELSLFEDGQEIDQINFTTGIRTIAWEKSAGPITNERWINWQCVVNGQRMFIKGVNWMAADLLLDLPDSKYEWALGMAKNMGTQLLRVWGAGLQEKDIFYDLCDSLGIMVWQDFTMNSATSNQWPQDIWESQILHTIFRVRNHPSLAVYCSGNETNPYSDTNAQAIGILERNLKIFDNTRVFLRTTPDHGSVHVYPSWDPAWYRQKYPFVPFFAETGFFGIANSQTIREYINNSELVDLQNMSKEDYRAVHPSVINHFAELNKSNINKLISRASHFDNLQNITVEKMSEASMLATGEFYQLMSESAQSNFPITTGLMPWVFKRSWPVFAANQLIDGKDRPVVAYYSLKRTYETIHICLALDYLLWKPGDTMPLKIQIINGTPNELKNYSVSVQILDDSFKPLLSKTLSLNCPAGPYVAKLSEESFVIPEGYHKKFMLAIVELKDASKKLVSRSVYYPRTIPQMEDKAYYETYRKFETPDWPVLEQGPWLKPAIENAPRTELKTEILKNEIVSGNYVYSLKIMNTGKQPAFMTKLDIKGNQVFYCSDNYFWLGLGEEQIVQLILKSSPSFVSPEIIISAWNSNTIILKTKNHEQ